MLISCLSIFTDGQALFKAFLQREFCEENLEFWLAIEDYHKASQSKLSSKAQKIYNEFILPQSPKEVNYVNKNVHFQLKINI